MYRALDPNLAKNWVSQSAGSENMRSLLTHSVLWIDIMAFNAAAETVKYLYLLFDVDNFIHNPGIIAI